MTSNIMTSNARNRNERGSSVLEFALVALFLVPTCMAVVGVGLSLGNSIKVSQTVRDTAHMFARGVKFDSAAVDNRNLVVNIAGSLGLTVAPGGSGRIIFSKLITPYPADCVAAGLPANCANVDTAVVIHRTSFGNTLPLSALATPTCPISADGNIAATAYLTHASTRAQGFEDLLAAVGLVQGRGEIAYVVEGFFNVPSLRFLGPTTSGNMYCRYIF